MNTFYTNPIINSPYQEPTQHWELDTNNQPTQKITPRRRPVSFISPIPSPLTSSNPIAKQQTMNLSVVENSSAEQAYLSTLINDVRIEVSRWRNLPPAKWQVTPATAQLLTYWRTHEFHRLRPFFCQIEAAETAIWLHEVAPHTSKGRQWLEHLQQANHDANPDIFRIALKLATGAGKTTVMAMLIAWQTINAVRAKSSERFTKGFLIVTPGITIRDRLRVLLPNDPENYFTTRELVPDSMREQMLEARIVITNYHAFMLREKVDIAKGNRALLQGNGPAINTKETPGQMLQRVMPELLGLKRIIAINDEAHHCYRSKPATEKLAGDDLDDAKENNETARVWISGLESIKTKIKLLCVYDLSATPFFLRGSGYAEGTLFPWTMSDFSLMDAIECGIVKLPRVPISSNLKTADDMPLYRNLWSHIGKSMPRKQKGAERADPELLPPQLQTALQILYGHYVKTFDTWQRENISSPPCFIIVCNNTASSKLVFDYIAGYEWGDTPESKIYKAGKLDLFRNLDEYGNPLAMPRTLLIDSLQLESGEALDSNFRAVAATEIEQFRKELVNRSGGQLNADDISDAELLREAMNTVGKKDRLGAGIRCVVSVSMLTEGWDANTVTHILGVRAFSTQLLCEQVIGRALRRQSYELNDQGLFDAEYADVFGIPFDFNGEPSESPIRPPRETVRVNAVDDRQHLEIRFPIVQGYRTELPVDQLKATFGVESTLTLTPEIVGPTQVLDAGLIGEHAQLGIENLRQTRYDEVVTNLTSYLLTTKYLNSDGEPRHYLYGQLRRIVRDWLDHYLVCQGDTHYSMLMYKVLAAQACEKITMAITQTYIGDKPIRALLAPYNSTGSTASVNFTSTKQLKFDTAGPNPKCHLNWIIADSGWEVALCHVLEHHPKVLRYVKNQGMGFSVPYVMGGVAHNYIPDFIVYVDDGHGSDDPLQLIVEVKGYRGEDAVVKKATMDTYWIPLGICRTHQCPHL
ncbi:MAG: DEAD/DEAH box helicase family protein [Chloroflexales bacterium]|nr:DEAD/DEAH box helicase family protein [Chloroflexales bacterium]